jgi:glycosyltransferase involved in cell wall biosynthesis
LQLQLIGGGNHLFIEQLRQTDVEIFNQLDPPEVLAKIGQSHVAILPLRTEEPFGLVALEAVRAGCVSLIGVKAGSAEILDAGHNYLPLYTRTAAEIAHQLESILLCPQNYRTLAANAWATAAILNPEAFVQKILALKDTIPVPAPRQLAAVKKLIASIGALAR